MIKDFDYEKWDEKYHNEEVVDLKKHLTEDDIKIIEKLEIKIKDKIYTKYEFEVLHLDLLAYYKDDDISKEELDMVKSLDNTGVSQDEYSKLLDKFENINKFYGF